MPVATDRATRGQTDVPVQVTASGKQRRSLARCKIDGDPNCGLGQFFKLEKDALIAERVPIVGRVFRNDGVLIQGCVAFLTSIIESFSFGTESHKATKRCPATIGTLRFDREVKLVRRVTAEATQQVSIANK